MRRRSILAGLLLGLMAAELSQAVIDKPVQLDTGLLSGASGNDPAITVYKGIPYAAPPVGALRWRPPAPPAKWTGVRKAESFGPVCPLTPGGGEAPPMSEDCLTLNVWTGAHFSSERRPVFFWLHVFLNGSPLNPQFDGEALARKGLVVVTLNYRIGALGFLATPELTKESGHNASGNYGVLDQIAALQWIKRNIAAFGGDPNTVTIAGMSSQRGSSVDYLAISPLARDLFARGISESQFPIPSALDLPGEGPAHSALSAAEAMGAKFVEARNVHTLAELRALPWQSLMPGPQDGTGPRRPVFQPIVDGWVVPVSYNDPSNASKHAATPFVVGNNLNEGGARPAAQVAQLRTQTEDPRGRSEPKLTMNAYLNWAQQKFGDRKDQFLKLYPASSDDEAAAQNNVIIQEYARIATWLWASQWNKSSSKPIFTYFWTHAPPASNGEGGGAGHGSEVAYAFNNPTRLWTEQDRKIGDIMSSYWSNIAKKGDPNGQGLPLWPALDPQHPQVMELGDHFASMPLASAEKLDFWKETYFKEVR